MPAADAPAQQIAQSRCGLFQAIGSIRTRDGCHRGEVENRHFCQAEDSHMLFRKFVAALVQKRLAADVLTRDRLIEPLHTLVQQRVKVLLQTEARLNFFEVESLGYERLHDVFWMEQRIAAFPNVVEALFL